MPNGYTRRRGGLYKKGRGCLRIIKEGRGCRRVIRGGEVGYTKRGDVAEGLFEEWSGYEGFY